MVPCSRKDLRRAFAFLIARVFLLGIVSSAVPEAYHLASPPGLRLPFICLSNDNTLRMSRGFVFPRIESPARSGASSTPVARTQDIDAFRVTRRGLLEGALACAVATAFGRSAGAADAPSINDRLKGDIVP